MQSRLCNTSVTIATNRNIFTQWRNWYCLCEMEGDAWITSFIVKELLVFAFNEERKRYSST